MKEKNITASFGRSLVKWFGLIIFVLVSMTFAATPAYMQSGSVENNRKLFDLTGSLKNQSSASIAAVREQDIKINFGDINFETAPTLNFPLLDGKSYEAVRNKSEGFQRFGDDEFTWRGKITGENNYSGDVILTVKGRALAGLIYSPSGVYEIIPQANFKHILIEIDQSRFPSCGGGITRENQENVNFWESPFPFERTLPDNSKNNGSILSLSQNSQMVDDGSLIDVMIVYTAAVRSALGGTTQTQTFAQQAIASANTAYQNSGITTRLRLVQTMEVSYGDSGTGRNALDWVTADATVAAARNTAKADMVAMLTENANDVCGIGWIMTNVGPAFASSAFSVTQRTCAVGGLTFAHELGHNQACDHNPENATLPPSGLAYPYAYGHWNSSADFRTIMSYSNPCPFCDRITYFSNPNISIGGAPIGIANQRDNTRVINNTALTISQFRESGGGGCTPTPIPAGQIVNGSLATTDCVFTGTTRYVDVYSFSGTAGQTVNISMNSSAFDTYLYLVNSSNQILTEDDDAGDGTNSYIPTTGGSFTLPATGTYLIWATSFNPNFTGAYNLTLNISGGGGCSTTPISVGQTLGGSLATTDCVLIGTTRYVDVYTFSGTANQRIAVLMNSAAFDTYLYLVNSSSQTIAEDDDAGGGTNSRIPTTGGFFTLPATGNYSIRATSFNPNFTGAYTVSLINETAPPSSNKAFDFDGDGRTDISIYRPSNGQWWINRSSNGSTFAATFGNSTDKIVPADYTGDGKTDIAIWRPSTREWFILRSENGTYYSGVFGITGDIPAPGDFDLDARADVAVFRPSTGVWYVLNSSNETVSTIIFGQNGDIPVVADYDGDSRADAAVFRPSTGVWWLRRSSLGVIAFQFGNSGDKPAPGDYTGNGTADVAFFRPSSGEWFILRTDNQTYYSGNFGANGDRPVPGDYDGDGRHDPAVYRPSDNTWYVQRSTNINNPLIQRFGIPGDIPVPSAYVP